MANPLADPVANPLSEVRVTGIETGQALEFNQVEVADGTAYTIVNLRSPCGSNTRFRWPFRKPADPRLSDQAALHDLTSQSALRQLYLHLPGFC